MTTPRKYAIETNLSDCSAYNLSMLCDSPPSIVAELLLVSGSSIALKQKHAFLYAVYSSY
eukprot:scaffold665_cov23-Cyclotella_meneghiniana.AAC.2